MAPGHAGGVTPDHYRVVVVTSNENKFIGRFS
jgi:hypothetical protein